MGGKYQDVTVGFMVVLLFIGAIAAFTMSAADYRENQTFLNQGNITTAVILKKEAECPRQCNYFFNYEYSVNERAYQVREEITNTLYDQYAENQRISIYYLPDHPSKSLLVGNTQQTAKNFLLGCIFISLLTLFAGLAWLENPTFVSIRKYRGLGLIHLSAGIFLGGFLIADDTNLVIWGNLVISVGCFVYYSYKIYNLFKRWRDIPFQRWQDTGKRGKRMPPGHYQLDQTLRELDFNLLGVVEDEQKIRTWLFISPDEVILAAATAKPQEGVTFQSWFGAKTVLETSFPHGDKFSEAEFFSQYSSRSVQAAYELHCQSMQTLSPDYGLAFPIRELDEALQWNVIYRLNHAQRRQRWTIRLMWVKMAFWFTYLLGSIGLVIIVGKVSTLVSLIYLLGVMVVLMYGFNLLITQLGTSKGDSHLAIPSNS